jgi:prevent-host-death family protein
MPRQVGITELKRRPGRWLRVVQRGHELIVLHRGRPIARIVPYRSESVTIQSPRPGASLHRVPLPPPLATDLDAVALLLEDRQRGR